MPQVEVEPSVSDRLGSLADKPIDLGDDVYFRFLNFGFCHQKTGLETVLTSRDGDDESYHKKCLVHSNPSRNFGFCLFVCLFFSTLRPLGSIRLGSSFIRTCSCCKSLGRLPGFGWKAISFQRLSCLLCVALNAGRKRGESASAASCSHLHLNATVLSSIDIRRK